MADHQHNADGQLHLEWNVSCSAAHRACRQCNRKKTKCDMARPTCGLCLRTGSECHFPTKRKSPSIGNKRKRVTARDLQGNLSQLLSLLQKSHPGQSVAEPEPTQVSPASLDSIQGSVAASQPEQVRFPSDRSHIEGLGLLERKSSSPPRAPQHTLEICDDLLWLPSPDMSPLGVIDELQCSSDASKQITQVSYDLAMDLVETFFQHVQPWLPMLHMPSFKTRCAQLLNHDADALAGLPVQFQLLMYSLFALSARHSSSPLLATVDSVERSSLFLPTAREIYTQARSTEVSTLVYLQGCILFTFLNYTERFEFRGWILIGVCVRVAYDLGLMDLDDEDNELVGDMGAVEKEEMRRAWWLVWELDTLSSIVSRRPFTVDRHRFSVNLPISDDAWFRGDSVSSSPLLTRADQCWKSLQTVENQDPRAWFLVANHLLSLICVQAHSKVVETAVSRGSILGAINCLKMSLPPSFDILGSPPTFDPTTFGRNNWILGTHLILMTAYFMVESVPWEDEQSYDPFSTYWVPIDATYSLRASQFSQIVARWPAEYVVAAHPFFMCMMLPTPLIKGGIVLSPNDKSIHGALVMMGEQVMKRFAKTWKLSSELLAVSRLLRKPDEINANSANTALAKCYAAYFPRYKRSKDGGGHHRLSRASNEAAQSDQTQAQTGFDLYDTLFQPTLTVSQAGATEPLGLGRDGNAQIAEWEGGSPLQYARHPMTSEASQ